jgi:hypothetical protein
MWLFFVLIIPDVEISALNFLALKFSYYNKYKYENTIIHQMITKYVIDIREPFDRYVFLSWCWFIHKDIISKLFPTF